MQALSRNVLFGLSSAVAVGAIAFISWRIADQNPRLFSKVETSHAVTSSERPASVAAAPAEPAPALALKGPASDNLTGGASISSEATFDVVRVEPSGEAVIAGRAKPGALVRLLNKGVQIAQVRADDNGQFALVPPSLGPGEHLLSLEIEGAPRPTSAQTVAVAIPADRKSEVVVALTEPGAAIRILSERPPASTAVAATLSIRSVEVDEAGGFYATGTGAPGSTIRLSLNGSTVTTVTANDEGRWSLKVQRGMNPGAYAVRADHLDAGGRVVAQAEVPFDYPARTTGAVARGGGASTGSDAVVPEVQSVTVQRGDSLWRISQKMLGNGQRYTQIYAANSSQIRNPSLIYPNQILVVPPGAKATN